MKFYSIIPGYNNNRNMYAAHQPSSLDFSLNHKLYNNDFTELHEAIKFILKIEVDVDDPIEYVESRDIIRWKRDTSLNAPNPSGSCIIISTDMLEVFCQFKLPSHQAYSIDFENYDINRSYVVFHVDTTHNADVFYDKCDYKKINMGTKEETPYIEPILSLEEIQKLNSNFIREENSVVHFRTKVVPTYYDIDLGMPNNIYISERMKNALESKSFSGIDFEDKGFNICELPESIDDLHI